MWQPIETAPRDQFLLLCGPSGYTTTPMVVTTGRMCSDYHAGRWIDHANDDLTDWCFEPTHWMPLPDLPGAQPAPSEKDEPVRKAWARFSNELHRSPDAPYPGMSEAFEKHFSQSFTDREWRAESGVWAAAWKAARNHGAQPAPSIPEGWKPIPEKHPTFDLVDLRLADGSVLCECVPQSDGDYWWEGPSGEVFIDPKYAPATHWRLSVAPEVKP